MITAAQRTLLEFCQKLSINNPVHSFKLLPRKILLTFKLASQQEIILKFTFDDMWFGFDWRLNIYHLTQRVVRLDITHKTLCERLHKTTNKITITLHADNTADHTFINAIASCFDKDITTRLQIEKSHKEDLPEITDQTILNFLKATEQQAIPNFGDSGCDLFMPEG